jgi:formylglycine-generating enzyme required for sulfatase activity
MARRTLELRLWSAPALGVVLVALCPTAVAHASRSARSQVIPTPVERALTGGLVALRAPASAMIRVARSRFVSGSSADDVVRAITMCAREPLFYRCDERAFSNELPDTVREVGSFYLDRHEVRREDFDRCVSRGHCDPPGLELPAHLRNPDLPATLVRASEAEAYCRSRGARLPTELELERASRGTAGRNYPWGNLWNGKLANHGRLGLDASDESDGFAELAPVGSFTSGRTPDGFFDLAGNAAEWTADTYSEQYGTPPDPTVPPRRSVRGGHYLDGPSWLRGAARTENQSGSPVILAGFTQASKSSALTWPDEMAASLNVRFSA